MNCKILIVDDEPTILESGKMILEDEGYKVMTAQDGLHAIDLIEKDLPDLVITDFRMPGLNGLGLINWIQNYNASLPVIMITSYVNRGIRNIVLKSGAVEFMLKPIDYNELIQKIEPLLQCGRTPPDVKKNKKAGTS